MNQQNPRLHLSTLDPSPLVPARIAELRRRIEQMADGNVLYSLNAYTPRHTIHSIILNGELRGEGEMHPPILDLGRMIAKTIDVAAELRAKVGTEAVLIWRCGPELGDDGSLYLRLCFEDMW